MKIRWFVTGFLVFAFGVALGAVLVAAAYEISENREANAARVTTEELAVGAGVPDGESRPGSTFDRIGLSDSGSAVLIIQIRRHRNSRLLQFSAVLLAIGCVILTASSISLRHGPR